LLGGLQETSKGQETEGNGASDAGQPAQHLDGSRWVSAAVAKEATAAARRTAAAAAAGAEDP